jgi:hypothetical protein
VGVYSIVLWAIPAVLALYAPFYAPHIAATMPDTPTPLTALWEAPAKLGDRDLFCGEWGCETAPPPAATYTFVRHKEGGVNPGVVVRDPQGREWAVKQPIHTNQGDEGPVEVVVSRVLSAMGYHR